MCSASQGWSTSSVLSQVEQDVKQSIFLCLSFAHFKLIHTEGCECFLFPY